MKVNKLLHLEMMVVLMIMVMVMASFTAYSLPDLPSSLGPLDELAAGVWSDFRNLVDIGLGDSRPELVHLKLYLAQFGYLNLTSTSSSSSSGGGSSGLGNLTQLFDSHTLAALQLYQQSFNLSVTGKLDVPTLLRLMTPRCGREDVADGIPLMLHSTPPYDHHVVGHYAFFPSKPTWPTSRRNLTYAFSSSNETGHVDLTDRRRAFAAAFAEWSAVVPVNFTEVDTYSRADIKIEFVSFSHGDGEPFDGVLGVLAHAFSPTDGRFHLDNSEFWHLFSFGSAGTLPQQIDLQSVVTHEIGHLLGLAHSPVENAIMYPSIAPGQVKLQLQQDDIQGAQALYGANPNYDPDSPLPGVPPTLGDLSNHANPHILPSLSLFLSLFSLLSLVLFYTKYSNNYIVFDV